MDNILTHGDLGLIVLNSCKELGDKVNNHICQFRDLPGDQSFIIPTQQIRFSNGEGKVKIEDSVRGKDIYILCDVGNHSCTYNMFGTSHKMGPDEHFQDIKRTLSAIGGKANRVTVIMPLLYASRQHKRKGRESLDCAMALNDLQNMGVQTIITFDVHDPTIHNSIPNTSFENIYPTYTMLKKMIMTEGYDAIKKNLTVISPDTGAMERAIYYANTLGVDVGLFYKRRDHSVVINGKNPIVQHEYLGSDLNGKNALIIDDMIASGESICDIIKEIGPRGINNTYVAATFAFFTEGIEKFNKLYEEGKLTKLYSTNLSYIPEEAKNAPWFVEVDLSKYLAKIINTLNHDQSISPLLDSIARTQYFLHEIGKQ